MQSCPAPGDRCRRFSRQLRTLRRTARAICHRSLASTPTTPPKFLIGRMTDPGVTNVRNLTRERQTVRTFCIITAAAVGEVASIYDRIALVLEEHERPVWLGEVAGDPILVLPPNDGGALVVGPTPAWVGRTPQ